MGKIYDALEKSDKFLKRRVVTAKASKKKVYNEVREEKVVPLRGEIEGLAQKSKIDCNLIAYHNPQSIEADIFKSLRTNILFPENGDPRRTILVTSPLPGDGKSFVSANLAVSIAGGVEENVILIDCDIRKPSIHKCFGISQTDGLSEYLSNDRQVADFIRKSPIEKLSIISSGKPPLNPTELLTSKKMKNLLIEVKNRYNDGFVILDSPPPALASETHAISKYVDGIIVVVKSGKTPRKAVAEVIESLGKEKIIGIIFNHAEQKVKKYYGHVKSYYRVDQP